MIPKKFKTAIQELLSTDSGQERNMYPSIKKIFESVGWKSRDVKTDVSIAKRGVIPDVAVVVKENGLEQQWIVAEAKSLKGLFSDEERTREILKEKKKYLTIETEWFVLIDPQFWRIVPVVGFDVDISSSKVFDLSENEDVEALYSFLKKALSPAAFKEKRYLQAFLNGDISRVATKSIDEHREEFFSTLTKSFSLFFEEAKRLFADHGKSFWKEMEEELSYLKNSFKKREIISLEPQFSPNIQFLAGMKVDWEEVEQKFENLKKLYLKSPVLFKLLYEYLWLQNRKLDDKFSSSVVFNSSLLLLSKVITIRFLEDYSFFGKKFFSNGGIEAFKHVKERFELEYTELIRQTARTAKDMFPTIMEETVYDWIVDIADERFSQVVEYVLYWLSFFDFSTAKEDILAGIYTNMVSVSTRKKLGQVFTPPWLADYIIKKILKEKGSDISVLDPACGSGTFLVSFFNQTVGKGIKRQIVTFEKALEVISKLHGNDIDPLASAITKLQLTWHILPFSKELKEKGFPTFKVSNGNALTVNNTMFEAGGLWIIYDNRQYDAVIGNPPYVRPEITKRELTREEQNYYGRLAKANIRSLFVYKALDKWLKENGLLGFVLPLSILDSDHELPLRELFKTRWTIREIIDLELAAKCVFPDVAVNPIVLIVENRPPTKNDKITLRFLEKLPEKNTCSTTLIEQLQTVELPYFEIFSEDENSRILSKLTPERLEVIKHIRSYPTFYDITRSWWRKRGERREFVEASLEPPTLIGENEKWEENKMIARGLVFRREKPSGSWNIYKGENILPCQLIDEPAETGIDVTGVSDPSFWRFSEILPEKAFAFMRISLSPTACQFNPRKKAFLDTATIFFPVEGLKDFPFDFLVLSSLYRFYYVFYLREGVVSQLWSNLYPRTLKKFPWTDNLLGYEDELKDLRVKYLEACKFTNLDVLRLIEEEVELDTVENIAMRNPEIEFRFSSWSSEQEKGEDWYTISFTPFEWMQVNDRELYEVLNDAVKLYKVKSANPSDILKLKIPANGEALQKWKNLLNGKKFKEMEKQKKEALKRLDGIVYEAFDLSEEHITVIEEAEKDSIMAYLKPPEPFTQRKLRGLWEGLDSADRYVY